MASLTAAPTAAHTGPFATARARQRYYLITVSLAILSIVIAIGLLAWGNPMPFGTPEFWIIANRRLDRLITIVIVVVCQAMATVAFQTVAGNRIITPSILGFESLYRAVQTSVVYFMGAAGLIAVQGTSMFLLQIAVMVGLAMGLYGWLLSGKYANLPIMLLVGIIIGHGLGSVSTFMQRLLTPSDFDVLAAQLFGSISNANPVYFPLATALVLPAAVALWCKARQLNLMALGRDVATNLGMDYRREMRHLLFLVSILMAVSTSMVGPMTFLGFLVATLGYQLSHTHDHRYLFVQVILVAFVLLGGAYFILNNIFYAQGVVSIIIEGIGGSLFLFVIMRKGRL